MVLFYTCQKIFCDQSEQQMYAHFNIVLWIEVEIYEATYIYIIIVTCIL